MKTSSKNLRRHKLLFFEEIDIIMDIIYYRGVENKRSVLLSTCIIEKLLHNSSLNLTLSNQFILKKRFSKYLYKAKQ